MKRRLITRRRQMEELVRLMQANPDVAKGICTKIKAKKVWAQFTNVLNRLGPPMRQWNKWIKVWTDLKFKTKKKLIDIKAASLSTAADTYKKPYPLNNLEEDVSDLLNLRALVNPKDPNFSSQLAEEEPTEEFIEEPKEEPIEELIEEPTEELMIESVIDETTEDDVGSHESFDVMSTWSTFPANVEDKEVTVVDAAQYQGETYNVTEITSPQPAVHSQLNSKREAVSGRCTFDSRCETANAPTLGFTTSSRDTHQIFGDFVADQMRGMTAPKCKRLRLIIQRAILELEEEPDEPPSLQFRAPAISIEIKKEVEFY